MKISSLRAKAVPNSRGKPTVEAEVETDKGVFRASVPSGVSKGKHEAVEVEAEKAVRNIERIISKRLCGKEFKSQKEIDEALIRLDGTNNKSSLGVNAVLAVSIACCRARAAAEKAALYSYIARLSGTKDSKSPKPCVLCIEGGRHGDNELSTQEFMIVPQESSFKTNFQTASNIYNSLKDILKNLSGEFIIKMGCEGGFSPAIEKSEKALDLVVQAIKKAKAEEKAKIYLDVAASEFFEQDIYRFEGIKKTRRELLEWYKTLIVQYPISILEDPFSEDDWEGWERLSSKFKVQPRRSRLATLRGRSSKLLIVGDDLTVTNPRRMNEAKEKKACNAVILKPNQIGTVSEVIEAANLAKKFGWEIIVSHRGGETEDDFIADLAVGLGAEFIKAGGPFQPERKAKYERLLQIEKEIG